METLAHLRLDQIPLFAALDHTTQAAIRSRLRLLRLAEGDALIREGDVNRGTLYIILEGEASVCKSGRSPLTHTKLDYEIGTRQRCDVVGATALIDRKPASATVIARTPMTIAILDLGETAAGSLSRRVRNTLIAELGRYLATRLRRAHDQRIVHLRQETEMSGARHALSLILVAVLSLMSFYTLALSLIPSIQAFFETDLIFTPLIIVIFASIFAVVIRASRFPLAFYGLRLDNCGSAMLFSLKVSALFLALTIAAKWLAIMSFSHLQGFNLISPAMISWGVQFKPSLPAMLSAFALYVLLVPAQEFVARSGVQAPLYAFLDGPEWRRQAVAIFVSNLTFAAAHAHTNLPFAIATFIPGILWGWIFARTHSLPATALSHVLIGGTGVFVFGVEGFLNALFH